jgi:malonyl-CoA/methylmalonyl-CoA synthetase
MSSFFRKIAWGFGESEVTLRHWRDHLPAGDEMTSAALVGSGTLLRAWSERWRALPDAPLWLERGGVAPGRGWWTAGEFEEATRRIAVRLRRAGFQPGERMLWSTTSSVAALCAHVGALRAGMVVVPFNPSSSERELAHVLGDVRPVVAIVERPDQQQWVRQTSPRTAVTGSQVDLPEVEVPGADPGPIDAAEPDAPALICYTSGTTGAPKGAVLTHRNLLAGAESVRAAWRWTPDDRLVHCLPVFHVHGLCVGVYGTLLSGGSAVLLPSFDPGSVGDAAKDVGASLFFGVPTMYHRLLAAGRTSALAHLRLCVSGSAPLSPELNAEVSASLGSPVLERYGLTETLLDTSNPYEGERRPGTVGFPLPSVEVRLAELGEILVRGPNVFAGYWERPAANADAFVADDSGSTDDAGITGYSGVIGDAGSWFRTGDIGVDWDGYLAIRGRSKELIISGGMNVYPAEVEDVLVAHPGVAEIAVTGTPSDEWGEVVTAWIVPDGRTPSLDELVEFSATVLAPYKRPRVLHVVAELPRNALGKVMRSRLGTA